jgi:restriction endonuclease S subunit
MMVFQKGMAKAAAAAAKTETVTFMGLNETVLVEATLEDLREKNYSLNYKQYLPQSAVEVDGFEMVKLGDLLKDKTYPKHATEYGKDSGKFRFHTGAESTKLYTDHPDIDDCVIIVNRTNGSGKSHIFIDSKCSVATQTITFSCREDITTQYVYYYLKSNIKVLEDGYVGANHKNLTIQYVNDIQIPLPSLEKQQEIVEQIDFYTQMAHTEEQSLNILEKIVMGWVKEMGRGKELVKLGEVCEIRYGTRITQAKNAGTLYPAYGGGGIMTYRVDSFNRDGITYKISRDGMSEHNCVMRLIGKYFCNDTAITVHSKDVNRVLDGYIGEWLFLQKSTIYNDCSRGTAQLHIDLDILLSLQIPLPSLAEQQMLQSDFDEIRHKRAKIAEYKAKAQEAIQRLIPGSKADANTKAANADTAAIAAESITSMSHSSICEVDEDGHGCTCRVPLEKEDLTTTASAAASAAVAIPEVSATAVSAPPVRRRPTKVAVVE